MRFEKISFEAFEKDFNKYLGDKFSGLHLEAEEIENEIRWFYDRIKLPKRSTKGSCGYDIYSPMDFIVHANEVKFIPTGIKVYLDDDKFLMVAPRSSSAKKRYQLGNRVAFIDADYVDNEDNEGDIIISLEYCGKDTGIRFSGYDAIAQGIIVPFFKVEDDDADGTRLGGYGSTDKPKEEDTTNVEPSEIADNNDIDSLFEEFERKVEVNNTESKPEEDIEDKTEEPVNDSPEEIKEEDKEKESLFRFNSHIFIDANIVNKTIVEEIRNMMDVIKTKDPNVFINIIDLKNSAKSLDDIVSVYNTCSAYLSNLNDKHILSDFYLRDAYINVLNSNYTKLNNKLLNEIYEIINFIRYEKKVEDKKLLDVGKMIYDKFNTIDNDEKLESFINELNSLVLSE